VCVGGGVGCWRGCAPFFFFVFSRAPLNHHPSLPHPSHSPPFPSLSFLHFSKYKKLTAVQERVLLQDVRLVQATARPPQQPEKEGGQAERDEGQGGRADGDHDLVGPAQRAHACGRQGDPAGAQAVGAGNWTDEHTQIRGKVSSSVQAGQGEELEGGLRGARVEEGDQPQRVAPAPGLDGGRPGGGAGEGGGKGGGGRGGRAAALGVFDWRGGSSGRCFRGRAPVGRFRDRARRDPHPHAQPHRRQGQALRRRVVMPERPGRDQAFRRGE
jgi:hypothetical protein